MARIKFGSLVSDISGSIGSATFQKSLYGNVLRTKPIPRFSSSPSQQTRRATMLRLHREWAALTSAQRQSWNRFISYSGGSINRDASILLTGHSLFIKYNFLRSCNGFASLMNPIFTPMLPVIDFSKIKLAAGDLNFYIGSAPAAQTIAFALKLSPPRSPTLSFSPAGLRTFELDDTDVPNWLLTQQYLDIFGQLPAVGNTLHFSMQWYSYTSPIVLMPRTGITIIVAV